MGGRGGNSSHRGNRQGRHRNGDNGGGGDSGGGGGGGGGGKGQGGTDTGGIQDGGGSGGDGGGGSVSPEPTPPKKWWDNLRRKYLVDRYDDQALRDDLVAVNPRFGEQRKWGINCQRCTATWEMRNRGFDVTARPIDEGYKKVTGDRISDSASLDDISRMWTDPTGKTGSIFGQWDEIVGKNTSAEAVQALEDKALQWPDGSRGFIYVQWKQGSAHIFNIERRGDKIVYFDGQPNLYNDRSWIQDVHPSRIAGVMRVDHLEPNTGVETWIRERTTYEINAPLFREMSAELNRRFDTGDPRRSAFRHAWDNVRKNKDTSVPLEYSDMPEMIEAYEQGLEWARRPD